MRQAMEDNQGEATDHQAQATYHQGEATDNQADHQAGQDHSSQVQVRQALQDNQVLDLGVTLVGSSDSTRR